MPSYHLLRNVGGLVPHDAQQGTNNSTAPLPAVDLAISSDQFATVAAISEQLLQWVDTQDWQPTQLCLHARHPHFGTVESFPDTTALFLEWGPASGSTLWFEHHDDRCELDHDPSQQVSPVELITPLETLTLDYGMNHVGSAGIHIDDRITIAPISSPTPRVNGQRVRSLITIASGDIIGVGDTSWTVQVTDRLEPPDHTQPLTIHYLQAQEVADFHPTRIEFPTAPTFGRPAAFPILSALVPLLMGIAIWVVTQAIFMAFFILFSFVFVIATSIESRRETKRDNARRREEFHQAVADVVAEVHERQREHVNIAQLTTPPHLDLRSLIRRRPMDLWHRSDPRTPASRIRQVYLGTATQHSIDELVVPKGGDRTLARELRAQVDQLQHHERPAIVDLGDTGGIAVSSSDERGTHLLRSIVCQLAMHLAPHELDIQLRCSTNRVSEWDWLEWLPQCSRSTIQSHGDLEVDESSSPARVSILILDHLSPEMNHRLTTQLDALENPPIILWGSDAAADIPAFITATCTFHADHQHAVSNLWLHHQDIHQAVDNIATEQVVAEEAEWLARQLSSLRTAVGTIRDVTHGPMTLSALLSHSFNITDPNRVRAIWELPTTRGGLVAPIGYTGAGPVEIDLRADGPHMLIAGTTGSGKSELLRTLLIAAALHNSPQRLNFLLIDYKGGAAFNSIDQLPHSVGLITDLTPELARRALVSLQAELRSREELLNEHEATSIIELETLGVELPSLLVAVDEFATLKSELPEFVDGLVDIAQRGRSLGIHLVLATQRPSGVLTDQIRANISCRIALRVTDPEESRDIIDVADAAHLQRNAPGRAILRTGPNQFVEFQSAWSSGPYQAHESVAVTPHALQASPERAAMAQDSGRASGSTPSNTVEQCTDVELAVRSVQAAHQQTQRPDPIAPWLEPLPFPLFTNDPLIASINEQARGGQPTQPPTDQAHQQVVIGLCDLPEQQRQTSLRIDLDTVGGIAIVGVHGSGTSTSLAAILHALLDDISSQVTDSATSNAEQTAGLLHCIRLSQSAVQPQHVFSPHQSKVTLDVSLSDQESTLRALRHVHRLLIARAGASSPWSETLTSPRIVLAIDGIATFGAQYESLNRGEAFDIVSRIARDGRSVGIHLVVTAERQRDIPFALTSAFGMTLQLRCHDVDDAAHVGLPAWIASPDTPPGRGVHGHTTFQIAIPPTWTDATTHENGSLERTAAMRLPTQLSQVGVNKWLPPLIYAPNGATHHANHDATFNTTLGAAHDTNRNLPEHGFAISSDDLCVVPTPQIPESFIIAGPPGSGKSSTLDRLIHNIGHAATGRHGESASTALPTRTLMLSAESALPEALRTPDQLLERLEQLEPEHHDARHGQLIIAIDDFDRVLDSAHGPLLEDRLNTMLHNREAVVIVSGDIDMLSRSYSPLVQSITSRRLGLLLDPDVDIHSSLLHTVLPRRDEMMSTPGRGWLVANKTASFIQVLH